MANKTKRIATTATEALKVIWEEGFFRTWRKKGMTDAHLAKKGNNFSAPELGMALMRAPFLTRKGGHGSYEYIQKHPFVAETATRPTKKNA